MLFRSAQGAVLRAWLDPRHPKHRSSHGDSSNCPRPALGRPASIPSPHVSSSPRVPYGRSLRSDPWHPKQLVIMRGYFKSSTAHQSTRRRRRDASRVKLIITDVQTSSGLPSRRPPVSQCIAGSPLATVHSSHPRAWVTRRHSTSRFEEYYAASSMALVAASERVEHASQYVFPSMCPRDSSLNFGKQVLQRSLVKFRRFSQDQYSHTYLDLSVAHEQLDWARFPMSDL